jgi:predicted nuclease of predicted toxin-antitoxin system
MRLLLDMNLSPAWVSILEDEGWETQHRSSVGKLNAPDVEIMRWARQEGYVVVTNDLDFSAILAATRAEGPSVIQIRGQDLSPNSLAPTLVSVLHQSAQDLEAGAILTMDLRSARLRTLPLSR